MTASTVLFEGDGPMKKSKFTEEQIAYALRQVESGSPPADICRQLGVSEATLLRLEEEVRAPGRE